MCEKDRRKAASAVDIKRVFFNNAVMTSIVLFVFIHGFKGGEDTFGEFPKRIKSVIAQSMPSAVVESLVYPTYDTRGNLGVAVENLCEWLVENVTLREAEVSQRTKSVTKAQVILCGHSMGGIVGADAILNFAKSKRQGEPLWPDIRALIAFDTPYYGVHPHVFSHQVSQAAEMFGKISGAVSLIPGAAAMAKSRSSSSASSASKAASAAASTSGGWGKWALAAGVGAAAAAAGTVAYLKKDEMSQGMSWTTSHLEFVGVLWKEADLKKRVQEIVDLTPDTLPRFHCFFTRIPPLPNRQEYRTFIVLPPNATSTHFSQNINEIAATQIDAHCWMFNASSNPGYYTLGNETVQVVNEALRNDQAQVKGFAAPAQIKNEGIKEGIKSEGGGRATSPIPVD